MFSSQARPKYQKEVRNYYGTTPLTRRHRPAVRSRSEKFNRRHNDSDNIKLLQYWEPQAATLLANKNGAPSGGESRTAVNVWFLEPHELRAPKRLINRFSHFAGFTVITNGRTDRRTDGQMTLHV